MSILKNMEEFLLIAKELSDKDMSFVQTGPREVTFTVQDGSKRNITQFSMSFLPGCKKVMVFHGVTVDPVYRNQGYGKKYHGFRLRLAAALNVKTAMCTVLEGNSIEKTILRGYGWTKMVTVSPGIEIWTCVL